MRQSVRITFDMANSLFANQVSECIIHGAGCWHRLKSINILYSNELECVHIKFYKIGTFQAHRIRFETRDHIVGIDFESCLLSDSVTNHLECTGRVSIADYESQSIVPVK